VTETNLGTAPLKVPSADGIIGDVDQLTEPENKLKVTERPSVAAGANRPIRVIRPTGIGRLIELWRFRELGFFLIWREIKLRYKQTALGAAWAVIQPVFSMAIFTLLFGRLGKLPNEGIPYPVFYYSALLPWTYFAATLASSGNSLIGNSQLVTKVYFPRVLLPASAAGAALLDFAIASLLLPILMLMYDVPLTARLLVLPLLIIPLVGAALGIGLLFSAVNVNYRDVKYVIPFLTQLWLFMTPVVYPITMIPERYRLLAALNPMTGIVEAFRSVVAGTPIDWLILSTSFGVICVLLTVGIAYFNRTERFFADVI
jgi:lipopolysaccharide transport system permease protein